MMASTDDETMPHLTKTRREFCTGACRLLSLAALGGMVEACGGGSPTSPSGLGSALSAVTAARVTGGLSVNIDANGPLAAVGGMALVQSPSGLFLVARTAQDTFTALTATCTHQACTITDYSGSAYVCPCHGSEFDTSGRVLRGPAPAPLRQYGTSFSNNVLMISA
jgi:cytochrome b6-f complex iron-sulfur subunit